MRVIRMIHPNFTFGHRCVRGLARQRVNVGSVGTVNLINSARILAQTVYYFLAYFHVRKKILHPENSQIQFVVSTGNFGNILVGYHAKRLGLPVGKLVISTNSNDILARVLRSSGLYEQVDSTPTLTPTPDLVMGNGKPADSGWWRAGDFEPGDGHPRIEQLDRLPWYLAYERMNLQYSSG